MTAPISFRRFALAFCVLLGLSAIPIFSTVLPPILDYPNHLARMHILVEDGASPLLNQFYTVHWGRAAQSGDGSDRPAAGAADAAGSCRQAVPCHDLRCDGRRSRRAQPGIAWTLVALVARRLRHAL
ncbi:MAG: hypothetical protein WDN69_04025 [Aliidongia sp.]